MGVRVVVGVAVGVAVDEGGFRETVEHGVTGSLVPRHAGGLADEMDFQKQERLRGEHELNASAEGDPTFASAQGKARQMNGGER